MSKNQPELEIFLKLNMYEDLSKVIEKLTEIKNKYPDIKIGGWGFSEDAMELDLILMDNKTIEKYDIEGLLEEAEWKSEPDDFEDVDGLLPIF